MPTFRGLHVHSKLGAFSRTPVSASAICRGLGTSRGGRLRVLSWYFCTNQVCPSGTSSQNLHTLRKHQLPMSYGSGSGGDWGSVSNVDLELAKRCLAEESAATETNMQAVPASQQDKQVRLPHVLDHIKRSDVVEVLVMKCPSPVIIRVMSLVLHILGKPKDHTDVSCLDEEHKFLAKGWLPPLGQPNRRFEGTPGGDDYIFWTCVQRAWRKEQQELFGQMRDLNVASVPPERLEALYQRREEPYLLPEANKHSPLASKLTEWIQALVAEWNLVRDGHL